MEERTSYQLYRLEGEEQRLQFEYECAFHANEKCKEKISEFWFSLKLGIAYLVLNVSIFFLLPEFLTMINYPLSIEGLAPIAILGCLALGILGLGAFAREGFGINYHKLKKQKLESDNILTEISQKLNKVLIQKEQLEEALAQEEASIEEATSVGETIENTELERRIQEDMLQCKIERIEYTIQREKKEYKEIVREQEEILKEEKKVKQKKKKYGILSGMGMGAELISVFLWSSSILFLQTLGKVLLVVIPFLWIVPAVFCWFSQYVYTFFGEDLWINKVLFKEMYSYSLPKRKEENQKKIQSYKEQFEQLEKEQMYLQEELVELVKKRQ